MGAAFAYDISFLRYYQYEKEQDNDFPIHSAHRSYVYYRFRGLSIVQGVLAGLRPAVIAMIASAGISLLILALYGQRTLPADLSSFDLIALVIFLAGFFVLRKWKPSPIKVMAGAAVAGVVMYSITT